MAVLTHEQPAYSHIKRGDYAPIEETDISFFESILDASVSVYECHV